MLSHQALLSEQYVTPQKSRHSLQQNDLEEDQDYSQGRSSISKTYSAHSTVDSPDLRPRSFEDFDLGGVLF